MKARSRTALVPLLAGIVVAVAGLQLGFWQLRRAAEKTELQHLIEVRAMQPAKPVAAAGAPLEWESVRVSGHWKAEQRAFIDNRVHDGRAGYFLVVPLELADGRLLLVNRGWLPAPADRRSLPATPLEAGSVEMVGTVRRPEPNPFRLGADDPASVIRQHLLPAEFEARLGRPVLPWYLQQTGADGDGLVRDWPRPDAGIDRHRGYAVQWFGLSALAGGLTLYYGFRSMRGGRQV